MIRGRSEKEMTDFRHLDYDRLLDRFFTADLMLPTTIARRRPFAPNARLSDPAVHSSFLINEHDWGLSALCHETHGPRRGCRPTPDTRRLT